MNKDTVNPTPAIFEHTFAVRYHELGPDGNLRPMALLNWLQDTAGMHTRQLGVSLADLRKNGLTWVVSRIHLEIDRMPRANAIITIRTWPSSRDGLFTCREYEVCDDSGACLARVTSSWAVLNMATRRPVRIDGSVPEYPLHRVRVLDDDFASLPNFPRESTCELPFRVMRSDLDSNGHVNNVFYVNWALEAVPDTIAESGLIGMEVSFRAEALYGDSVISRCSLNRTEQGVTCLHQIINARDSRELARLITRWKGVRPE